MKICFLDIKIYKLIHFLNWFTIMHWYYFEYIEIYYILFNNFLYILTKYGAIIRYILAMENNVAKKKYIYMGKIAMFAKIFIF